MSEQGASEGQGAATVTTHHVIAVQGTSEGITPDPKES
jgi:hypothetical protein